MTLPSASKIVDFAGATDHAVRQFALCAWRKTRKTLVLTIAGESMLPLIAPGDSVDIRLARPCETASGDIVAYFDCGHITVHRLICKMCKSDHMLYCQQGDNCTGWGWIEPRRVIGKVTRVCRKGRAIDLTRGLWPWVNPFIAYARVVRMIFIIAARKGRRVFTCLSGSRRTLF